MVANLVLPQPTDLGDEWGNSLNTAIMGVNSDVEALKGRSIAAGAGLTGGGDLSVNLSLAIDFASDGQVSSTKAVRANDSRLSDARTPLAHSHDYASSGHTHDWASITSKPTTFTPTAHTHPMGDVTGLATALAAKVDESVAVSAGPGLTGGGTLVTDRDLEVDWATAAPLGLGVAAAVGTSQKVARGDHVHPAPAYAWQTWNLGPTGGANITGGYTARYVQIGKTVHARFKGNVASNIDGTSIRIPLPIPAHSSHNSDDNIGVGAIHDPGVFKEVCVAGFATIGSTHAVHLWRTNVANTTVSYFNPGTMSGGNEILSFAVTYEAA